jgi:hypothetical protein
MYHSTPRGRATRAVSPVIAVILMLGLTIATGALLWSLKINTPPAPTSLNYIGIGDQTEPAWGDPTDCTNTTIHAACNGLPAVFVVVTGHQPDNIPVNLLLLDFRCNGTSLLNGTLKALEVVPGTGANPGVGSPKLGACGAWHPNPKGTSASYFNRLMYFQQIQVGATTLINGDQLTLYVQPPGNFCDRTGHCPDDDYHGAPPWCFQAYGACTIYISYLANPQTIVATIPVYNLGR